MRLHTTRVRKITSRLLVPALVLWLGGASFLNCCAKEAEAASPYGQTSAEEPLRAATAEAAQASCHSQEHCQKAYEAQAQVIKAGPCGNHQRSDAPMFCCARAGQTASPARKARVAPESDTSQTANNQSPSLDDTAYDGLLVQDGSPLSDNRAAYLRHCVLLI